MYALILDLPGGSVVKNQPASAGNTVQSLGLQDSLEKGMATQVFLPKKSPGQRSLVGYSPWGCKRVIQNLATK